MASSRGAKRRIYFLEPVIERQDGSLEEVSSNFWSMYLKHLQVLPQDRRRIELYGRKYIGEMRTEISPAEDYLYLGKARRGADWPDISNADGVVSPLALGAGVDALIEPAYLLPVSGTTYVAVLRTSGGPSFSAIESWMSSAAGLDSQSERFVLRPYVRTDQIQRLNEAEGATKVHLKVDPGAFSDDASVGALGNAMRQVQDLGAGGVSVDMTLSFGNARPDHAYAENVAEQVRAILGKVPLKVAEATLLVTDDEGRSKREKIDFVRDRVTGSEYVGTSEDEPATPAVVLVAMTQAIRTFKKSLGSPTA
jgi:hypothetical protein